MAIRKLRAIFKGRKQQENDVNEELRFHLERQIESNMAAGMSVNEARRQALIAFGGVQQTREAVRQVHWTRFLDTLLQDLRYAWRMLIKRPAFTSVMVSVLTIGIGANTAVFSIVNAVLLKMLPITAPEKLVSLRLNHGEEGGLQLTTDISYPVFERLREQNQVLSGILATGGGVNKVDIKPTGPGANGQTEQAGMELVSGGYFQVLGVNAVVGRTLTPGDDKIGAPNAVAVVSHGYWKRRMGLDPAVLGKTFVIRDMVFTIVGVAPPGFFGETVGQTPDMWVPLTLEDRLFDEALLASASTSWVNVLGRLKPGVGRQQAEASLGLLVQQANADLLGPKAGKARVRMEIAPASKGLDVLRQQFARPLQVLMAVVGLVLLIACVSVASLLTARATARQKEIAVRATLGAGSGRLMQQMLTESILLALIGGTLGLFLAWSADRVLPVLLFHSSLSLELEINTQVLGFTLLVSVVTGIIFGFAPMLRVLRPDLSCSLKEHAGIRDHRHRLGARKIFIVAQVALSLLLLVTAGLFVRSLRKIYDLDVGFNKENLLLVTLQPSAELSGARLKIVYQDLLDKVNALPGVKSSSLSMSSFADGNINLGPFVVEGYTPKPGEDRSLQGDIVSPGFFNTMGIPLRLGRDFRQQDDANATRVVIVNETFARYFFGAASPLGKHFAWSRLDRQPMEIIGVVKDAKYSNLKERTPPYYYTAFLQQDQMASIVRLLEVRTAANPATVSAAVSSAVDSINGVRADTISTMTVQVEESLQQEKMLAQVSSSFGVFALLLACIGIYGVMAHSVTSRTNEIGIRMALGAEPFDVLWMVLREALFLVGLGIAVGIPAALAGTRLASSLVSGLLFGMKASDPVTMALAALMMAVVALLAGYLPARRATKVDPLVALRYE
ncbi:MAG TPA: ABC transporter permease [Candidatus Angelobacter sp.]